MATTIMVGTGTSMPFDDTGVTPAGTYVAGSLSAAIAEVDAMGTSGGPYTIQLTSDIDLSGPLPPILGSVTIDGKGHTITASGTRIFMVGVDAATQTSPQGSPASTTSIVASRPQVTIQNVTLAGGDATGGTSAGLGGGGLGAGGAIFVNQTGDVTLSSVTFTGNSATGGAGGTGTSGGGRRGTRRRRWRRDEQRGWRRRRLVRHGQLERFGKRWRRWRVRRRRRQRLISWQWRWWRWRLCGRGRRWGRQ